jgi:hypothetical protein
MGIIPQTAGILGRTLMIGNRGPRRPPAAAYLEEQMSAGMQEEIRCYKHILMGHQTPGWMHSHIMRPVGSELGFEAAQSTTVSELTIVA